MSVQYIDQTLFEGIASRISYENLVLMAGLLQSLPITLMDVPLEQAGKYPLAQVLSQEMLRAVIQPTVAQIHSAYRLGFRKVVLLYHQQPGMAVSPELELSFGRLQQLAMAFSLKVENASTLQVKEIEDLCKQLAGVPVDTFIYSDSSSMLEPFSTYERLQQVQRFIPFTLEFHGHNAHGLATANTLSAIRAGVQYVATAIAGVGDAGHAPFEEVVMAAKHLLGASQTIVSSSIAPTCTAIMRCFGKVVAVDKAIIGPNIFAHESGLHVDGVVKNPKIYEPFSPEEVGLSRYLVIGKHSGSTSLQVVLRDLGVELDDIAAQRLLKLVRTTVVNKKSFLSPLEVLQLGHIGEEIDGKDRECSIGRYYSAGRRTSCRGSIFNRGKSKHCTGS
ncbi:2-isopropylmalate synthase [Sporomusa carbonis]|uniref:homocitrate synthase/isopropylmalate synthase family protein n=1 Tax=Sporomusa carbonis TaxID=3076075 RepID=UPI003A74131A